MRDLHSSWFAAVQGTGMALEDAHALAAAIGEHGAAEAALRAYEAARVPRISHISNVVMVRPAAAAGLLCIVQPPVMCRYALHA